jgi:hypothetical protein
MMTLRKTLAAGAILLAIAGTSQTATNFTCNDCAGNPHDLFTELDAGKVIVLAWVMPCSSCIGPTVTASNIVQSYASSNPGQVFLYVADDYANTNCTSLNSWCTTNSITGTTFSDASIDMTDYGSPGMPKIVVLGGGTSHTVFFNQNNTAAGNAVALQNAIDSALAVGVNDNEISKTPFNVFPNPATDNVTLEFNSGVAGAMNVMVYNTLGQEVMFTSFTDVAYGTNRKELNLTALLPGCYVIRLEDNQWTQVNVVR